MLMFSPCGLGALDDAFGIDAVGVRVGGRVEHGRQLSAAGSRSGADEREHQADAGDDENDLTAHPNSPLQPRSPVILPSSMRTMRSANS
jgi:hypothetical protein